MTAIFIEGFDKYGGVNNNGAAVQALLQAGDWSSAGTAESIVAGLSATGFAAQFANGGNCVKALGANFPRLIGGARFNTLLLNSSNGFGFQDGSSYQCNISFNTSGQIVLKNGSLAGTIIATSAATIAASSTHYLEWDLTFSNSGAYQIWLDGVSILSGTADLTTTANNYANAFQIVAAAGSSPAFTVDDLYIFDTTGTRNNAVLLNSPRIETTFPSADSTVAFAIGASALGQAGISRSGTSFGSTANQLYVRPFTPSRSCTLNSISVAGNANNGTINFRPVVYSDSGGVPSSLLATGATVTGITSGSTLQLFLTTPISLTAGTQYWLGFMCDTTVSFAFLVADASNSGRSTTTVTFASGAPGTAPSTTSGQTSALLWGNITLATPANFYEVNLQPPPATNQSYVSSSNVADEDLYSFPALSITPDTIHTVAVKAYCARSDSGARSVSMRMWSGGVDSGGSLAGQTPGTSYGWLSSYFQTDPLTGLPWSPAGLNAATRGFRIDA